MPKSASASVRRGGGGEGWSTRGAKTGTERRGE